MTHFVVDASVVVKWFVPEVHSAAAARLLDSGGTFSAPDLLLVEVGNTVWKKVLRGELTAAEASTIVTAILSIETVAPAPLLPAALEIAIALKRSVYDSLYLALAVASNALLVTADRKFYSAIRTSALAPSIAWIEDDFYGTV